MEQTEQETPIPETQGPTGPPGEPTETAKDALGEAPDWEEIAVADVPDDGAGESEPPDGELETESDLGSPGSPASPDTPSPAKRGPGRPPKPKALTPPPAPKSPGVREPPEFLPATPGNKRRLSPAEFFEYWHGLPERFENRLLVYVYRLWPIIRTDGQSNIEKIYNRKTPKGKPYDLDELVFRHGSGDYKLILNDQTLRVMLCYTIIQHRDMRDAPPLVDVATLVVEDAGNREYVRYLRQKGVPIPGDPNFESPEEKEGNMAEQRAVDKLTDAVLQMAQKNQEPRPPTPPTDNVKAVVDGATASMALLSQSYQQALTAQDPRAYTEQMLAMAKAISPDRAGEAKTMELFLSQSQALTQTIIALQAERVKDSQGTLERVLAEIRASREAAAPTAQNPAGSQSLVAQLKELGELRDTLKDLFGPGPGGGNGDGDGDGGKTGPTVPWELIAAAVPAVMTAASSFFDRWAYAKAAESAAAHNAAVARTGQGVPVPPPPPPGQGAVPGAGPMPPGYGAPGQGPGQQQQQQAQQQGDSDMNMTMMYNQMLSMVASPLITHINDQGGLAFADWLVDGYGVQVIEALGALGQEKLTQLLMAHPQLGPQLRLMPDATARFVAEVLSWTPGDGDGEGEGEGEGGE